MRGWGTVITKKHLRGIFMEYCLSEIFTLAGVLNEATISLLPSSSY